MKPGAGSREPGASTRTFSRVFLVLFLFFAPGSDLRAPGSLVFAAERISPVSVKVRAVKSKIKIGDELRLLIQIDRPRKFSIVPPDQKINISPFEIKQVDPVPVKQGQNRVQETYRMTLTVFQIGDLRVPPIPIRYADESGNPGQILTEPVPVKVLGALKKITDKDDIRAIKGPVSSGLVGFWSGVMGWLAAALLIFLIAKVTMRKLRERKDLESLKPPHERVKLELGRLKDKGFLEEKKYKEFYSELSDILRRYLERQFRVEALEKTTSELNLDLQMKGFDKDAVKMITEVLNESDLVKFAKFAPGHALAGRLETLLLESVERTKPEEEKGKK